MTIDQYVDRLKNVSFHDQISSMYDKMARTKALANLLGQQLGLSDQELADLARAASIYKFDLTTQMVGEFAELQGIMGKSTLSALAKTRPSPPPCANTTCQFPPTGPRHKRRSGRSWRLPTSWTQFTPSLP